MKKRTAAFLVGALALALLAIVFGPWRSGPQSAGDDHGPVIHEVRSEYSHILIREKEGVRRMIFIDPQGRELVQSELALDDPGTLLSGYSRTLFAALLFHHPQEKALFVGLGGGSMLRFLESSLPETQADALEIDPVVVELADRYFDVRSGPKLTIHTVDAYVYIDESEPLYDAIYMDAYLFPEAGTEDEKVVARLRTLDFLRSLQKRLTDGGIVAFNLVSWQPTFAEDLAAIHEVFPQAYEFIVPGSTNLVVIGSMNPQRLSPLDLVQRASELDREGRINLRFLEFAAALKQE